MSDERLELRPLTLRKANAAVLELHRHHGVVQGHLWSISAWRAGRLVGVAIIGRPVAGALWDGRTCEVTRVATDGTRNACSFLYGAAWRAARALGYVRALTYTLASEPGTSLLAAGWTRGPIVRGRSWSRPRRPRTDKHPTEDKVRWQVGAW